MTGLTSSGPTRRGWSVLPGLLLLSAFPVLAGALRVLEVVGGPQILLANVRVETSPEPLVVHVVAATLFALLGALQFSARLRSRRPRWHRRSGRVLVGAGLAVALSGLWMTLFYAGPPVGCCCGPSGSWSALRWASASCWASSRSVGVRSPPTARG